MKKPRSGSTLANELVEFCKLAKNWCGTYDIEEAAEMRKRIDRFEEDTRIVLRRYDRARLILAPKG